MRYRKKALEIEAIQYKVIKEVPCRFCVHKTTNSMDIAKFMNLPFQRVHYDLEGEYIAIDTLEGTMKARVGDYIIKGVKGEFYPCKSDIFEMTYESVK